ncbi:condensation domain-containing protein, partial [Streptomyces sp. B6B3]|uniref:condensation domain-containing protein n=1 Tax=Streptomyces sp. B6B3 TaxID=3153570 RepID=UPI00325E2D04
QLPPPTSNQTSYHQEPRSPHEEILHQLYTDVLNQPNISTHDSFFALGGDSLQATRLISRIHTATGTHIPIRDLFQHPTIHALATHTTWTDSAARPALLPTPPRPDRPPLSHGQQRMWFLHHHEGPNPANNIPHATRLHGPLNTGALQAAFHDVARRHEILRTLYRDNNGVPYQHILSPDDPEALPGLSVLPTTTATLNTDLAATLRQGFDIENEIPWRATLHRISPTDHVLVLVVHHIAADGWSLGTLTRELAAAYTARLDGNAPEWAPLPLQYADYATWQRAHLPTSPHPAPESHLAEQLAYWTKHLAGLPSPPPLPTDRSREHGGSVPVVVDAEVHRRLLELARRENATLFMVVQAGLVAALSALGPVTGPAPGGTAISSATDVVLGTVTAGRSDPVLGDVVGLFANTLVLRTDASGNPSFLELLRRVKDVNLAAHTHQDIPFDLLTELLRPVRYPPFQVILGLDNLPRRAWELPGLRPTHLLPSQGARGGAMCEVALSLEERTSAGGEAGGIDGVLWFDLDAVGRRTGEQLAALLLEVLLLVAGEPSARIDRVHAFLTHHPKETENP